MGRGYLGQWEHIREEIVVLCIEWYISYPLTYSQLKKVMEQRGFRIDPRTINHLIYQYSSLADKRLKEAINTRKKGWRVVQIPFRLEGRRRYLYRAVDAQGHTLDFLISASRSKQKAKAFFSQSLTPEHQIKT
jgi:putative transposase